MADATGLLLEAILAILNADAGVQAACGRATECAVAWDDFDLSRDPLPILVVEDLGEGGSFLEDSDRVVFLVAGMAAGAEADAITGALMSAVAAALTTPALTTRGLDACVDPSAQPFPRDRVPIDDEAIPDLVQRTIAPAFLITP